MGDPERFWTVIVARGLVPDVSSVEVTDSEIEMPFAFDWATVAEVSTKITNSQTEMSLAVVPINRIGTLKVRKRVSTDALLSLHAREKLGIRLRLAQTLEYNFHLLDRRQRIEHATHDPDSIEIFLPDEQLFLTRSRTLKIDRRIESFI